MDVVEEEMKKTEILKKVFGDLGQRKFFIKQHIKLKPFEMSLQQTSVAPTCAFV